MEVASTATAMDSLIARGDLYRINKNLCLAPQMLPESQVNRLEYPCRGLIGPA
jgi:hypothetical protein